MTVDLDSALWLVGDGITAVAIAIIFARKIYRTLPVFTAYLIWGLVGDVIQQIVARHYPQHNYALFVIGLVVDSLFQFGVIVELSWAILRPIRDSLPSWSWIAVAALFALAAAVIWPFASGPGVSAMSLVGRLNVHLQITFSVLRILLFLAITGCSQLLSIGWRDRELQVATGLGFYSMVSLAVWNHHTGQVAGPEYHRFDQLVALSYVCSLAYWVFSFALKEAERREFTPQMHNFLLAMAGSARNARMGLQDSPPGNDRTNRK